MSNRVCDSLGCGMYDLVKNTLYYTTYAAGRVGGSIPSGIAKIGEGVAYGSYKLSQLYAHTDTSGNRHGFGYTNAVNAAGVVLAGFGISYAGYKLIKGQPLIIQKVWSQIQDRGTYHIQLPPLSAFLRAAAGIAMMVSGALMPLCTFYHGTWGVEKTEPSYDHTDVHQSLLTCREELERTQQARNFAEVNVVDLRNLLATTNTSLFGARDLLGQCQTNLTSTQDQVTALDERVKKLTDLVKERNALLDAREETNTALARTSNKCAQELAALKKTLKT